MILQILVFSSEDLLISLQYNKITEASDATASQNFLVREASKEAILFTSSKLPIIIPLCTSYIPDDSKKEVFDAKVISFQILWKN